MKTSSRTSGRKFIEVLNDVKAQVMPGPDLREPLLISGRLEGRDLEFIIKQAFSLTRGCLRHLFYLVLHMGIPSKCIDVAILTSLIQEYRHEFLKALWGAYVQRQKCGIEVLMTRLEHVDHLLYLVAQRLVLCYGRRHEPQDFAQFPPSSPRGIELEGTISYYKASFLKRARPFSREEGPSESLFRHLFFLSLLQGRVKHEGAPGLSCMQDAYSTTMQRALMGYLARTPPGDHQEALQEVDCLSRCECCRHWCRKVFDLRADEHLVKIGSHYMIMAGMHKANAGDVLLSEPAARMMA
jgi:hypothetical protein